MKSAAQLILYAIVSLGVIFLSVIAGLKSFDRKDTSLSGMDLRIAMNINKSDHLPGLTFGLNYELLSLFAESQEDSIVSIVISGNGESYLDSLKHGTVDLVVIPYADSLHTDGLSFSIPIEGGTVWAVRSEHVQGIEDIDAWLETYSSTEEYKSRRDLFLLRYSPSRRAAERRSTPELSPYDEIVKRYAHEIGWDWRMLSALIYNESKFHIEATSSKGAKGLMQTKPNTAARYGITDLLNPENSIKAGTAFIKRLQNRFSGKSADFNELTKFVLAAYNAGEGRINDCINYASLCGVDSGYWENVTKVIPQMRDTSILQIDTVKHGIFQGKETIGYVDRVLSLYDDFKVICP